MRDWEISNIHISRHNLAYYLELLSWSLCRMATEVSLMLSSTDALAWLSLLSASDDGGGIGADFLAVFVAGGAVSAS